MKHEDIVVPDLSRGGESEVHCEALLTAESCVVMKITTFSALRNTSSGVCYATFESIIS